MANPAPGFVRDPGRTITVEPHPGTVTVSFGGAVVASSQQAKVLREGSYPPVIYIPFEDIYFEHLEKTGTVTHCPFKGDASYWRVRASNEAEQDAMWAYEAPYDEMLAIKDHGAFYPDRVTIDAA